MPSFLPVPRPIHVASLGTAKMTLHSFKYFDVPEDVTVTSYPELVLNDDRRSRLLQPVLLYLQNKLCERIEVAQEVHVIQANLKELTLAFNKIRKLKG